MTLHLILPDPDWLLRDLTRHAPEHPCSGWDTAVEAGLQSVARLRPDAVFFSFSTPGEVPWQTAMRELKAAGAEVIVLSAWPTLAYEAYRLDAAGFLLLPPDPDELREVLRRVERRIAEKSR